MHQHLSILPLGLAVYPRVWQRTEGFSRAVAASAPPPLQEQELLLAQTSQRKGSSSPELGTGSQALLLQEQRTELSFLGISSAKRAQRQGLLLPSQKH